MYIWTDLYIRPPIIENMRASYFFAPDRAVGAWVVTKRQQCL